MIPTPQHILDLVTVEATERWRRSALPVPNLGLVVRPMERNRPAVRFQVPRKALDYLVTSGFARPVLDSATGALLDDGLEAKGAAGETPETVVGHA